jgi:hypothetical protein
MTFFQLKEIVTVLRFGSRGLYLEKKLISATAFQPFSFSSCQGLFLGIVVKLFVYYTMWPRLISRQTKNFSKCYSTKADASSKLSALRAVMNNVDAL